METRKIEDLDVNELRRELTERRGFTMQYGPEVDPATDPWWCYLMFNGLKCGHTDGESAEDGWQQFDGELIEDSADLNAPPWVDWLTNTEAALILCLELMPRAWIGVQKWGREREYYIASAIIAIGGGRVEYPKQIYRGDTKAIALSRLALSALRK